MNYIKVADMLDAMKEALAYAHAPLQLDNRADALACRLVAMKITGMKNGHDYRILIQNLLLVINEYL